MILENIANFAGKEIQERETVGIGTEFQFGLILRNQTHEELEKGDFDIIFSVLDSSSVCIHQSIINAKQNVRPSLSFIYILNSASIPAGDLIFKFEIKDHTFGVHTKKEIVYYFSIQMIATEITFLNDKKSYK